MPPRICDPEEIPIVSEEEVTDAHEELIRPKLANFFAWTGREVCLDEVELVRDLESERGHDITGQAWFPQMRILLDIDSFPTDENVLYHELCHLVDLSEGLSDTHAQWFVDEVSPPRDLDEEIYDTEARRISERFALLCEHPPIQDELADTCAPLPEPPEPERWVGETIWRQLPAWPPLPRRAVDLTPAWQRSLRDLYPPDASVEEVAVSEDAVVVLVRAGPQTHVLTFGIREGEPRGYWALPVVVPESWLSVMPMAGGSLLRDAESGLAWRLFDGGRALERLLLPTEPLLLAGVWLGEHLAVVDFYDESAGWYIVDPKSGVEVDLQPWGGGEAGAVYHLGDRWGGVIGRTLPGEEYSSEQYPIPYALSANVSGARGLATRVSGGQAAIVGFDLADPSLLWVADTCASWWAIPMVDPDGNAWILDWDGEVLEAHALKWR